MRAQSLIMLSGLLLLTAIGPAANAAPQTKSASSATAPQSRIEFADASPTASMATNGTAPAAAPADKKICRRIESSISRVAKKVCLTKREWDQIDREAY
jgi:hypothetical protein